jgi:hypothetical protein
MSAARRNTLSDLGMVGRKYEQAMFLSSVSSQKIEHL